MYHAAIYPYHEKWNDTCKITRHIDICPACTIYHEINIDPAISKAQTAWTVAPIHSHMQSNQVVCNYLQSMIAHCGFGLKSFVYSSTDYRPTFVELTLNTNRGTTNVNHELKLTSNSNQSTGDLHNVLLNIMSTQEPKHFTDWGQRWPINSTGIEVHVKCTCWSPALMQHCITIE